jgi:17beta-estradiol 17-dehydrogenase / very-long-chain 3-oxoacyl-CoA reductase
MVINCLPISCLTNLIIPLIQKRKLHGAIINISSGASQNTMSGTSHYSATKAFDDFFTRTVAY